MKSYNEAKKAYIKDHKSKNLVDPKRRLNALTAIEEIIRINTPDLLIEDNLFKKFDRVSFIDKYLFWKGTSLNSAENSVIIGLFKFSN